MKNKVVLNQCYGGFGLSKEAYAWLHGKYNLDYEQVDDLPRHDKRLVECVELLGRRANTMFSNLKVLEISGNKYQIFDYDGSETLFTPEDTEWIIIED